VPRPPRNQSAPQISHGQASYVLDRMVAERRVSPGEISRYLDEMQREINDLERRLESLRHAAGAGTGSGGGSSASSGQASGAAPARRGPGRPPGGGTGRRPGRPAGGGKSGGGASASTGAGAGAGASAGAGAGAARTARRRGRTPITAEQLASRQLQGRYLGLIRQIPASRRGQYQRTAKERGREAAIKEMQSVLGK
jgi:hypothetical protein